MLIEQVRVRNNPSVRLILFICNYMLYYYMRLLKHVSVLKSSTVKSSFNRAYVGDYFNIDYIV